MPREALPVQHHEGEAERVVEAVLPDAESGGRVDGAGRETTGAEDDVNARLPIPRDADASLRLALQKIGRAKKALAERNTGTADMELEYAVLSIEDARSLLTELQ